MKKEFIDSIKSRGYWRINFRPVALATDDALSLNACEDVISQSAVRLRGWDYPHIPGRRGDDTGIERHDKFVQGWVDWMNHREFWRMYTSSQFLHYRALHEDWVERNQLVQNTTQGIPETPVLGVLTNLWLIVEICEFLSRLVSQRGLYQDGVGLSLQFHSGPEARTLWIEDPMRVPFTYDRTTSATVISFERTVTPAEVADPKTLAAEVARHIFDRFGWEPSDEQLAYDIDKLYHL